MISNHSLDLIAKQSGFKQRASKITPKAFLNTVFFSNSHSCPTLSDYCIDLRQHGSERVSKQAMDKRFNESTKSMLTLIVEQLMSLQVRRLTTLPNEHFKEIRIMDSTEFKLPKNLSSTFPGYGGKGREAIAQVQFEYDLLGGKITDLSLGSALDSDAVAGMKNLDQIPEGALLIRDLGYFSPKAFAEIETCGLYFISRAKPQWSMYIHKNGELVKLTIDDIKNQLKAQKNKYLDLDILIGAKVLTPVRLIVNQLNKEQTKNRIKKKKANGSKLSKLSQESACLNLFVTNVERAKCLPSQIYELYTVRWQIELIFKTWKSILNLHSIHPMNAIRFECVVLIKFIWVMLNWSLLRLIEEVTKVELSLKKLTRTLTSKSTMLTASIINEPEKLLDWLYNILNISQEHHKKEYKKGTKTITEIIF